MAKAIFFFLSFRTFYYLKIYYSLYIILRTSFLTSTLGDDWNIFFSKAFYFWIYCLITNFWAFKDFLNKRIYASTFFNTFLKAGESAFFFGKNDLYTGTGLIYLAPLLCFWFFLLNSAIDSSHVSTYIWKTRSLKAGIFSFENWLHFSFPPYPK